MKKTRILYMRLKRLIDFIGSLVGIVIMSILFWWWIIIVNSIVTKGHPLFLHERVGKDGKAFKIIKFRSMKIDANPNMSSEYAERYKMVTAFGGFLRSTSLDETIQLVNILKGDMAFIGPRPVIAINEDLITIEERKQNGSISLRPGLGGYAQVHGRVNVTPEEKGKLDGYYYEHLSFWLDIKIFFLSIIYVFKRKDIVKTR